MVAYGRRSQRRHPGESVWTNRTPVSPRVIQQKNTKDLESSTGEWKILSGLLTQGGYCASLSLLCSSSERKKILWRRVKTASEKARLLTHSFRAALTFHFHSLFSFSFILSFFLFFVFDCLFVCLFVCFCARLTV